MVHFWEDCATCYLEWEELADGPLRAAGHNGEGQAPRPGEEERARLADELAEALLADPRFRAASG